jgi:spermidine/putrescine transport system substrate-binding protein
MKRSRMSNSTNGLVKVRSLAPLSRRQMMQRTGMVGAAALGATALGGGIRQAHASTNIKAMMWEGYDVFLEGGDYLAKNDITLDKTYIGAPEEIIAKLRLAPREVDVSSPYFIQVDFMAAEGLLMPLDLEKIPNFKNLFPAIVEAARGNMTYEDQWYSAPFTWASIPLMYNADEVEPMESWMDMLRPEFKGKSAIPADPTSVFATWGRVVTGNQSPNRMTLAELDETIKFLIDMKKNHLRTIAASYGELGDLFARKEILVCEGAEWVAPLAGDVPVKWSFPKEGTMTYIEGYSMSAETSDPEACYGLINNALSVEGQVAGAEYNGLPITNAEALPMLSDFNRATYPYENIESFFTTNLRIEEMYLLEEDGTNATWDDYIQGWETVMKA